MNLTRILFADSVVKSDLTTIVQMGMSDNVLLHGSNGTGKSLIAETIADDFGLNQDVNCVFDTSNFDIKTVLNTINFQRFQSSIGLVIINEVDRLKPAQQHDLQAFIDTYCTDTSEAAVCRVVLTTNNPNAVLPAIKSRCRSFHITGPTPQQATFLFGKQLAREQVVLPATAITSLLTTTLGHGCTHLDYRKVKTLFQKVVFKHTGSKVIWQPF